MLPFLSCELANLGSSSADEEERLSQPLWEQLGGAIRRGETDSILWLLYILRVQLRQPLRLDRATLCSVLDLDDDLVWVALGTLDRRWAQRVGEHLRTREYLDAADYQAHWLARYEFWRTGWLDESDLDGHEKARMKVLKNEAVRFSDIEVNSG